MFQFFFGRSLQPRGLAETLCGSPLYMAPEIMQLQKYDAKVIFTFSICKNPSIFSHNLLLLTSTKYAGRSLECWCHSLSTCDWKNTIYRQQSDTGFFSFSFFYPSEIIICSGWVFNLVQLLILLVFNLSSNNSLARFNLSFFVPLTFP